MLLFLMNFWMGAVGLLLSCGLWIYFILKKDRIEREPLLTFVLVGLAGGVISVILSFFSNAYFTALTGFRLARPPLPVPFAAALSVFVGINEEFWKCAAAVLLVRRLREFDEPADGIIYAMAVSLGFAAIENIFYMMQNGMGVLIARTFLAVPAHLGFGALWGSGLAAARFRYPTKSMPLVLAPYVAASALCHAFYDFWLFAGLPFGGLVTAAIVLILWSYASRTVKTLVARSPFLVWGQCPECGARNLPGVRVCVKCGADMPPEGSP
jgi:RsiW-degrading membrane proteinase PrsW (M82 family)